MKFLISLAWKNLSRYRKRTIITASAIAFGLAMYLFMDAWLLGADKDSERNFIWYETGSMKIQTDDYWQNKRTFPLKYAIDSPQAILDALRKAGINATARTQFSAEVIVKEDPFPQDGSMRVIGVGIDPARDGDVFHLKSALSSGRWLEPGEEGLMMGAWLAEDLGAEVGYPVTIVMRTREGYYQTIDLTVTAILDVPNPAVNKGMIFIPLDLADYTLEMDGGVTEIAVGFPVTADILKEKSGVEEITGKIVIPGAELRVLTWKEMALDFLGISATKKSSSNIMLFLVFVIAAVGISNTMLMAVYERTKELGMMRALGMKDRQIRFSLLFEAGGIGFLGSAVGTILGVILVFIITKVGFDFSFMLREIDVGYRIAGVMYGAWHPQAIVTAFVSGIVLTMIVSVIPTSRALKMEITDCLRDE